MFDIDDCVEGITRFIKYAFILRYRTAEYEQRTEVVSNSWNLLATEVKNAITNYRVIPQIQRSIGNIRKEVTLLGSS